MVITVIKKTVINSSAHHLGRCLAAIVWLVRILKWVWLKQRSRNVVFFCFFPTKLVHQWIMLMNITPDVFRCLRWGETSASVRHISERHAFFHANPPHIKNRVTQACVSPVGHNTYPLHPLHLDVSGVFLLLLLGFLQQQQQQSSICLRPPLQSWRRRPGLQTPQLPIQSSIHGMSRIKCSP